MQIKKQSVTAITAVAVIAVIVAFVTAVATFNMAFAATARAPKKSQQQPAYPIYGDGPVEVRLYTDYFCLPCRAMKPEIDPVLKELVESNKVRLVMIDMPNSKDSVEYSKEYLRCLHIYTNDIETAIALKSHFHFAAEHGYPINDYLNSMKIARSKGRDANISAVLSYYNAKISEDQVRATPTCIIEEEGKKESYVGRDKIIQALKNLKTKRK